MAILKEGPPESFPATIFIVARENSKIQTVSGEVLHVCPICGEKIVYEAKNSDEELLMEAKELMWGACGCKEQLIVMVGSPRVFGALIGGLARFSATAHLPSAQELSADGQRAEDEYRNTYQKAGRVPDWVEHPKVEHRKCPFPELETKVPDEVYAVVASDRELPPGIVLPKNILCCIELDELGPHPDGSLVLGLCCFTSKESATDMRWDVIRDASHHPGPGLTLALHTEVRLLKKEVLLEMARDCGAEAIVVADDPCVIGERAYELVGDGFWGPLLEGTEETKAE